MKTWIMAVFTMQIVANYTLAALDVSQSARELLRFGVIALATFVLSKLLSGQPERVPARQNELVGKPVAIRPAPEPKMPEK